MVPEDGFDDHLISPICPLSHSRLATLITPHSSEYPPVSVVVGRICSHEVTSPNTLVTSVADVI